MVCRPLAWSPVIAALMFVSATAYGQSEADTSTAPRQLAAEVVNADYSNAANAAAIVQQCGYPAIQKCKGGYCAKCTDGGCGVGHGCGYGCGPHGCCAGMVDRYGHYYKHCWHPYGWHPGYCGCHGCPPPLTGSSNMYEGYNADLFYNYYAPQGSSEGVPTDMYVAPHDTPWPAIQVYYTYQPWLPHEYLYNHNRTYTRWYGGGLGRNTTRVTWGGSPIQRTHAQGLVW